MSINDKILFPRTVAKLHKFEYGKYSGVCLIVSKIECGDRGNIENASV